MAKQSKKAKSKTIREEKIRDFIVDNFEDFSNMITNKVSFEKKLIAKQDSILKLQNKPVKILDTIRLSLVERLLFSLPQLDRLTLIKKEFNLLNTPSGLGKKPSADILAYTEENYCLALIELKKNVSSERQMITELSAYNQGLQNRFHGLSKQDVLWLPIATDWRTTTKSAIEFQQFWQNQTILPLKMEYSLSNDKKEVTSVEFELFDPVNLVSEVNYLNLFSKECFDTFDYFYTEDIEDKQAFINYVSSICAAQNINGFIIFHKPTEMMFPFGFTLCIYNPYKGHIHRKYCEYIIKTESKSTLYKEYHTLYFLNTDWHDVNFLTDKLEHFDVTPHLKDGTLYADDSYWKKDFLSVSDFGVEADHYNIHYLVQKIIKALDSKKVKHKAFGTPLFEVLFDNLNETDVESISYFGLHHEIVSTKIRIEHARGLLKKPFLSIFGSFKYLKKTFQQYNKFN